MLNLMLKKTVGCCTSQITPCKKEYSDPFFPAEINQWPNKEANNNHTNSDKAGSAVGEG